jgi:hypothetical protein
LTGDSGAGLRVMPHIMSWLEASVAIAITLAFPLSAMLLFKDAHVEHHPTRVYVGAAMQGMILGVLIGFVIVPLRFAFFNPDPGLIPDPAPARGVASLSILPAFILLIIVRRGLLARVPLIGRYIRAYRRAALKWQIDRSSQALARLVALDDKKAET